MPATIPVLDAISKEIYEGKIVEQLNSETVALKRIEGSSAGVVSEVGGKYVTFPLHVRRNTGIGARREMENLPSAGQQGHVPARIGLKYLYGAVQLSGQAIALIDKNYQAFQSALETELDGLKRDLSVDQNRQIWGDGTGSLGVVVSGTGAAGSNTLVLKSVKNIFIDMNLDIYASGAVDGATPTSAGVKVLTVNYDTNTITTDGPAQTPVAGQFLTRAGSAFREWTGFGAIINDTGILYNVNPATEPLWKSKMDRNGGTERAISEGLLTRMADKIDIEGGRTTAIFTTHGVNREYANLLTQQRQFVNTKEFTGGFSGLAFTTSRGEIPIVVDKDAPKGKLTFVNEKAIKRYRESDWHWLEMGNGKWQQVPNKDAFFATMVQYSELGTNQRNTHGAIENVAEDE